MDGPEYGASHPLDVQRAKAAVGEDNRFSRLRESMHKQLEERAERIEKVPLQAMDIFVDYLFYQHHMLGELLTSSVEPGNAVNQIHMQGRIEQVRILAQELATSAAMRRATLKEGKDS